MFSFRKRYLIDLVTLLLYAIFFGGMFLEVQWVHNQDSVNIGTVLRAIWATAGSGVAIAIKQAHRWVTGYPIPIQSFGIGFGLQALGVSLLSASVLLYIYYSFSSQAFDYLGKFFLTGGMLCMVIWLIRGE